MHRVFSTVVRPLLDATRGQPVLEVGAGAGILTRRLVQSSDDTIHAVDPAPQFDPAAIAGAAGRLVLHDKPSLSILPDLPPVGLALLDGDPNYYTVANELTLLTGGFTARGESDKAHDPVIVVHNVGWPFGGRDGYYDPESIPQGSRRAYTRMGVLPGHEAPSPHGLGLVPFVSEEEGLPGTGVLTAVKDFVQGAETWELIVLPGLHGVAVLASHARLQHEPALREVFEEFGSARFMSNLLEGVERERIAALVSAGDAEGNGSPVDASDAPGHAAALAAGLAELSGFEADRLDALQSRIELLERDRDVQLREATARLRALEGQHDRLIREAAQAQAQLEAERRQRDFAEEQLRLARQQIGELEQIQALAASKQEQLGSELQRARRHGELLEAHALELRAQLEAQADAWSGERERIGQYAERAADSRAWRIGHRLTSIGYRLTLRANRGTSALGRLQQELRETPRELDTSGQNTPALPAGPRPEA